MQRSASWAKYNHHICSYWSITINNNLLQFISKNPRAFFYKEQQNLDKINRKHNLDRERDIVKKTIWVVHRHGGKFPWHPVVVFSLLPWNQLERESNPTQTTRTTSCHWNQRTQSFFLQKVTKSWNRILIVSHPDYTDRWRRRWSPSSCIGEIQIQKELPNIEDRICQNYKIEAQRQPHPAWLLHFKSIFFILL